ncbi:MAG: ROK family protein [Actinobacteria bacterium]|nr:ROK family protein [Actinomycetota bacterium]
MERSAVGPTAGMLFDLVRGGRATTRTQLGELTGLSRTAVTARVGALVSAGLLLPGEEMASTGGRPPGSLEVNPAAGSVLALAIGRSRVQLGVYDLTGAELASDAVEHEAGADAATLMPQVVARARALMASAPSAGELVATGLSLPGAVDEVRVMSIDSPVIPGWDGVELAPYLARLGDAPVVIGNDADVLAYSELLGRGRSLRDALVLKASTGLGLGIVADGQVLKGHLGAAGEIGHTRVARAAGLPCRCGATGCLETIAGGWALVAELASSGTEVAHVRDLVAQAGRGNADARSLLRRSGREIGEVLAMAINLLNPEAVVIGGDMALAHDLVAAGIRESVYAHAAALATRDLRFLPTAYGERSGLVGCAALALDGVLHPAAVDVRLG